MSNFTIPDYKVINENFEPTPMIGEVFKPVPDYPGYEVSDFGRVVSRKGKRPRVLKASPTQRGHLLVSLHRGGKMKPSYVHRIVSAAHLGSAPDGKTYVLHANDIPADNRLQNLRYGDNSENSRDKVLNGGDPQANRTHCPLGHAYNASNTRVYASGSRQCISCNRARSAARTAAKIGRTFDFHEHALSVYTSLTSAPGADLTPVISTALAQAANPRQAKTMRDKVINDGSPKASKTHCKYGHAFVVASTRVEAGGSRKCISCQRARAYVQYSKKIGRALNFIEDADRRYIELTSAPGADLTPVISTTLALAA